MEKIFHWTNTFKTLGEDEDGSIKISGLASTNALDRTGDVINHDAWTKSDGLENYKTNPIILFNHDYNRPIGRATSMEVGEEGLEIGAKISKSAGEIKDLIKDGVLGAFSVGFRVKDADYNDETDGYKIKDAELFEVSVVSVPANQTAMFSIAKSFDSQEEYEEFKKTFISNNNNMANSTDTVNIDEVDTPQATDKTVSQEKPMSKDTITPEANSTVDLKAYAEEIAQATAAKIAMQQAEQKAKEQAEADEVAELNAQHKAAEEAEVQKVKTIVEVGMSGAERLMQDVEKRVTEKHENLEKVVSELRTELTEKKDEIEAIRESKRIFGDRQNSNWEKAFGNDINDAWTLGLATGKGWNTKLGQETLEKVNAHSGVGVSSADFEQTVSTNVERDIQLALTLAPLFREIPMTSATQIIPILPDAGYAEFTANQTATGTSPHGNLEERGDTYDSTMSGIDLTERTLSTKKLISQSYLGNETEEDAILPILPLIRESIVRAHARGIENALLVGNHADGVYGTSGATFEGLVTMAGSNKTQSATAFASESLTALHLLAARKNMGKYGMNAADVTYIVNSRGYFELLEDAEFQDVNLVGDVATKLRGEIGSVFGSKILVCDEFAAPAVAKFYGVAVYAKNYVMPRLRGITIESDYEVANQRRVLVASQRIGFTDMIDASTSAWALQYKAS
jgi:HK97 family phage prohead protease